MSIAVGMIETLGFPAIVEAADAWLKQLVSPWWDTKKLVQVA